MLESCDKKPSLTIQNVKLGLDRTHTLYTVWWSYGSVLHYTYSSLHCASGRSHAHEPAELHVTIVTQFPGNPFCQ